MASAASPASSEVALCGRCDGEGSTIELPTKVCGRVNCELPPRGQVEFASFFARVTHQPPTPRNAVHTRKPGRRTARSKPPGASMGFRSRRCRRCGANGASLAPARGSCPGQTPVPMPAPGGQRRHLRPLHRHRRRTPHGRLGLSVPALAERRWRWRCSTVGYRCEFMSETATLTSASKVRRLDDQPHPRCPSSTLSPPTA